MEILTVCKTSFERQMAHEKFYGIESVDIISHFLDIRLLLCGGRAWRPKYLERGVH